MRSYTRRDSAVDFLRKQGVPARDYALLITIDNTQPKPYSIDEEFLAEYLSPKSKAPKSKKSSLPFEPDKTIPTKDSKKPVLDETPAKPIKSKKTSKKSAKSTAKPKKPMTVVKNLDGTKKGKGVYDRGRTVSSVARELILKGLDNNTIYAELVKEFDLGPEKKYYPAWYRSELRKKGVINY